MPWRCFVWLSSKNLHFTNILGSHASEMIETVWNQLDIIFLSLGNASMKMFLNFVNLNKYVTFFFVQIYNLVLNSQLKMESNHMENDFYI